jgi:protein SCO1
MIARTQPQTPVKSNIKRWLNMRAIVTIVAIVLAAAISIFWGARQKAQQGFFGQRLFPDKKAYDFHLMDQNGNPFQLSALRGKLVLFSFGYTHCPDICPTTLTDFATLYESLSSDIQKKVQILFISVDPKRDTPQVMAKYIPYFQRNFLGLTGSKQQIDDATKAYGITYEYSHTPGEDPDIYTVNHSTYIYLVNAEGNLELLYDTDKLKATDKVAADIKRLLGSH